MKTRLPSLKANRRSRTTLLALPAPPPHLVPMPDPTERLNAALEGRYSIDELAEESDG